MNMPLILALIALGSMAVNVLDWRFRGNERFLYQPQSRRLRFIFNAWTISTGLVTVLFLEAVIPELAFLSVFLGLVVLHSLYSIVRRHRQRFPANI